MVGTHTHTHTHSHTLCLSAHTPSPRDQYHIATDQRDFRAMVNRWMKCRKSTVARLELNLFPLHFPPRVFLSLFLSVSLSIYIPPSLPPHLHLLRSPWRERSVLPLLSLLHKEGGRGPLSLSWPLSLSLSLSLSLKQSTHAHLIAVHFSLQPSLSAYTSVHLPLQTLPLLSASRLREKTGVRGGEC